MAEKEQKSANELAVDRTDLAVERTVMAANRSLMAWTRTSLSLISFGFTIYKFLQAAIKDAATASMSMPDPRRIGLMLIALGTLSSIAGAIEYFGTVKRLNKMSETDIVFKPVNISFIVGLVITLLGLFLFITIMTHTEVF
jgi:putative membrane protein